MKFIKWLFSTSSRSKKYKNEFFFIIGLLSISSCCIFMLDYLNLSETVEQIVRALVIISCLVLFFPWISRMLDIAYHKGREKIINSNKKIKYLPVYYKISEVKKWLKNATEPDTIYAKGINEKNVIIEVSYETKGKKGPFINKKIFINNDEVHNFSDINKKINSICFVENESIQVLAITYFDNPLKFKEILNKYN